MGGLIIEVEKQIHYCFNNFDADAILLLIDK